jgi:hypothetical protein
MRDNTHKGSIVACIKQHVDSVSAVLILTRGDYWNTSADMDCTLSALSALLPKTLVNNIAFMFTHVLNPPSPYPLQYMVPGPLNNCIKFFLDNPMISSNLITRSNFIPTPGYSLFLSVARRRKDREKGALGMLVKLFDWLDSLEPQPATEIVSLYEQHQNIEVKTINIFVHRAREIDMRTEIDRLMITLKKYSSVSLSSCRIWRSSLTLVGCRT